MSTRTLREQLEAIRAELFPQNSLPPEKALEIARRLSSLVPKALDQQLRACLQASRRLPMAERREWVAIIITELASLRGEFFVSKISEHLREELQRVTGKAYLEAVGRAKEAAREHRNEQEKKGNREHWSIEVSIHLATISSVATEIERPLKPLSDRDLELCLAWANRELGPGKAARIQWDAFRKADPNEALRLWAARSAEKAAIGFLAELGKQTTDVSIGQLEGTSGSWKTHDVEADGEPIDVKNARPSFSSPNSYVEHTIPRFKQIFRNDCDVTILGIVSDYVPWARIEDGQYGSSRILGQLRHGDLQLLTSWMGQQFGDVVDVSLISKTRLLTYPGWMFEYADDWYSRRSEAIEGIGRLLQECPDPMLPDKCLPLWANALLDDCERDAAEGLRELDLEVFQEFVSLRGEIGISRRSLFAWILGLMLRTLVTDGGAAVCDTAVSLRRLLFRPAKGGNGRIERDPAGLFDPMEYISNLIALFEQIGNTVPSHLLKSMRFFKLAAPTILRGQLESGDWQTVFAHCGGWRRQPFSVPCGNNPIHLGNSAVCPECRFLICSECGHCMNSCSACESRMSEAIEAENGL
jgi:hypothetical protein